MALLCEGTHLEDYPGVTEEQVADKAFELTSRAEGRLVVADFGPRNVDRLSTFLGVAEQTGRRLAIQPKDACLLGAIFLADPTVFPSPLMLPALTLYDDPKSAPRPWETELRERWAGRIVGPREVSARPGDYLLCYSLFDLNDLLDLDGVEGGVYLYSNSRAYDEEQAVDLERLRNWVRHAGLRLQGDPDDPQAARLHSSGHATGADLLAFVQRVNPRRLIPIHTEDTKWWTAELAGTDIHIVAPRLGEPIRLDSG